MKLTKDKILHFSVSYLMMLLISLPLYYYTENIHSAVGLGVLFTLSVGAAKEVIWDYFLGKGQMDIYDMGYNFIGVYLGAITSAIIINLM